MKYLVLSILISLFVFGVANAQERGIGVTPAEIVVEQNIQWPYTVPITVTNFSAQEEQFEVFGAQANPGRFVLEAGASRQVAVTFDPPAGGPAQGIIKVLSMQTSESGLSTGTGIKIPFRVQGVDNSRFLASANQTDGGNFPYIFGAGILLITLFLLWQMAGIVRVWIFNSSKQ